MEAMVASTGDFPDTHETGVCISMIAVPERAGLKTIGRCGSRYGGQIVERLHYQFNCGGGIRHEYEVEIIRIGIEETEGALSHGFDALARIMRRGRMGVWISKKVCSELAGMTVDQ